MSNYTISLQRIAESLTGQSEPAGFNKIDTIINESAPLIFDFDFPFYNDSAADKLEFEKQFILHFYTREIGVETFGWWKVRLKSKLVDVMPKYKQLYEIEQKKYNIYDTVSMEKTVTSANNTTGKGSNKQTSENSRQTDDLYSDTPQGQLENVKAGKYVSEYRYLDDNSASTVNNTNENSSTHNGQQTEKWSGKESGLTYSEMKVKEREAILNINLMLIDEFEELFMGVF